MGFALLGLGFLLVVAGARDTQSTLFSLVQGDFTGPNSFLWWLVAIGVIGGMGYAPALRSLSHAILLLIFVVFLLSQNKNGKNIFEEFNAAISGAGTNAAAPATVDNSATNSVPFNSLAPLQPLPTLGQ